MTVTVDNKLRVVVYFLIVAWCGFVSVELCSLYKIDVMFKRLKRYDYNGLSYLLRPVRQGRL